MKRTFWLGIVAALTLPAAGCDSGKGCQQFCEEANECPNVTDPQPCEDYCKERDELLQASGCTTQQSEYFECLNKGADLCAATTCVTEALTLNACITDYCMANPSECPTN